MPIDWLSAPDYTIARLLVARGLAAIYLIAFVVGLRQFPALLGERGLLPVPAFVRGLRFRQAPSLFLIGYSDALLRLVCGIGIAVSAAILVGLGDLAPLPIVMAAFFVLWALYLSIVNVGQQFYSFGWESLLLEAGFLGIFLGNDEVAPPTLVLLLFRWLAFRVEFGAGLIKIRGDRCWRDLGWHPVWISRLALELVLQPARGNRREWVFGTFDDDLVPVSSHAAECSVGVHEVERVEREVHHLPLTQQVADRPVAEHDDHRREREYERSKPRGEWRDAR